MNFDPVHIHKARRSSVENIVFLLIPITLFVIILILITFKDSPGKVSGVSTQGEVLTQDSKK